MLPRLTHRLPWFGMLVTRLTCHENMMLSPFGWISLTARHSGHSIPFRSKYTRDSGKMRRNGRICWRICQIPWRKSCGIWRKSDETNEKKSDSQCTPGCGSYASLLIRATDQRRSKKLFGLRSTSARFQRKCFFPLSANLRKIHKMAQHLISSIWRYPEVMK